jgi:hypothetical protein
MEEELGFYKKFVADLFQVMRTSSDHDLQQIINVIRSGAPTSEVQNVVTYVLTESKSIQPTALLKAPQWD